MRELGGRVGPTGGKEAQAEEATWVAAVEVGECRGEAAWGRPDHRGLQGQARGGWLTPAQEGTRLLLTGLKWLMFCTHTSGAALSSLPVGAH